MIKKTGNLAEEIVSPSAETQSASFDASAFLGSNPAEIIPAVDETPGTETIIDDAASVDTGADDDNFSWDTVGTEEVVEEIVEEGIEDVKPVEVAVVDDADADWDEEVVVDAATGDSNLDWGEIGKEAGIEATTREEFIAKVKESLKPPVDDNETITNLNTFLEMSDKDLVIADMRAAKYDADDIEDTISRLDGAGLLKREATLVRNQLTKHIHSEKDRLRGDRDGAEKAKDEKAGQSKKELQSYIKDKEDFFGGKVSQKEKKQLYNYITKGDFAQNIFESHANVAEAAFLWQNKSKIFKMIRTQGVEQGKSRILDGITSPNRGNRSSTSYEAPSKGFNPNKFLAG